MGRNWVAAIAVVLTGFAAAGAGEDPRTAGYRTPPGWKLAIAATEPMVVNPVLMTWGPDGRLYVVEWKEGRGPNDHIKVLTDADADGVFDRADVWMAGFDLPSGLAFWDGWTYITLDHDVVRFHDPDMDGKYDKREVVLTGFGNDDSHHRVSGLTIGPDGWLYMSTGDSDCHAKSLVDGRETHILRCGGILRCRPDGTGLEMVAMGMRNPWGNVAFDDEFRMFHTDNDNEGSPGFTGCRILHVVDGGDYGWRLREGARCCQPDFERATWNGGRPGRLGWITETGRGAPAGLCILNSAAFPSSMRNLIVYPDVFRKLVRAYKVKPRGATFEVAEEFELVGSDEGLFRPNDAEIGPDGALYVLDWRTDSGGAGALSGNGKTGRIYRLTWGGTDKEPSKPTLDRLRMTEIAVLPLDRLFQLLDDEDYGLRYRASLELMRRGDRLASVVAGKESKDEKNETGALWLKARESVFKSERSMRHLRMTIGHWSNPPRLIRAGLKELATEIEPEKTEASDRRLAYGLGRRYGLAHPQTYLFWNCFQREESDPEALSAQIRLLGSVAGLPRSDRASVRELLKHGLAAFDLSKDEAIQALKKKAPDAYVAGAPVKLPGGTEAAFQKRKEEEKTATARLDDYNAAIRSKVDKYITADLLAERILEVLGQHFADDPFLADMCVRALENQHPAGLENVIAAISSDTAERQAAGLYALQGWRGRDGLVTAVTVATDDRPVPVEARAGMFRMLREQVVDVRPEPIARWLATAPAQVAPAKVEAIRLLTAMHERALAPGAPVLPKLLADPDSGVRKAALGLAANVMSAEAKAALLKLATGTDKAADERRLAVAALRAYGDKGIVKSIEPLTAAKDVGLQGEALRTIADLDTARGTAVAEKLLDSGDADLRREAIGVLGRRPETALVVAKRFNEGKLPKEDLGRVIEAVRPHATKELQYELHALMRKTLLAAPTGAEAARLREDVARKGNSERGREIYFDAKKGNCATCHRIEGVGGAVGPDLTRVYETLSFEKRVESILDPSKEIKEGFSTFKVATKDGKVLTGLLLGDTPEGVTLKDAQGQEIRVPAGEVEEKGTDKVSLMPVGVVGHLSFQEFADLLAFLGDKVAQEKLRKP